jgi:hypothetical protein
VKGSPPSPETSLWQQCVLARGPAAAAAAGRGRGRGGGRKNRIREAGRDAAQPESPFPTSDRVHRASCEAGLLHQLRLVERLLQQQEDRLALNVYRHGLAPGGQLQNVMLKIFGGDDFAVPCDCSADKLRTLWTYATEAAAGMQVTAMAWNRARHVRMGVGWAESLVGRALYHRITTVHLLGHDGRRVLSWGAHGPRK